MGGTYVLAPFPPDVASGDSSGAEATGGEFDCDDVMTNPAISFPTPAAPSGVFVLSSAEATLTPIGSSPTPPS